MGYWNVPDGAEQPFHPVARSSSLSNLRGDVFYATGDYDAFTHTGELILLGRRDSQVKINGQRVDLTEIRTVVDSLSAGSYILPVKDHEGRLRLFGILVKNKGYSGQADILPPDPTMTTEMFSACRALLPSYAIPKFILSRPCR